MLCHRQVYAYARATMLRVPRLRESPASITHFDGLLAQLRCYGAMLSGFFAYICAAMFTSAYTRIAFFTPRHVREARHGTRARMRMSRCR